MLDTKNLAAAGIIGSLAAACECEMDGKPIPLRRQDVGVNPSKKRDRNLILRAGSLAEQVLF